MFKSIQSRLTAVACAAWTLGAFVFAPNRSDEYLFAVLLGWLAIGVTVYGAVWVIDGKGFELRLPRWAGYVLIALLAIVIMGLPKAIHF